MDNVTAAITILTVLALVAAVLYLATFGRRIRFPRGPRSVFRVLGIEVTVVVTPSATGELVDELRRSLPSGHVRSEIRAALAAMTTAWARHSMRPLHAVIPRLAIHFSSDVYRGNLGVQTYASAAIGGNKMPMLVIDEKFLEAPRPLVIHELTHVLGGELFGEPDRQEERPELWGPDGLEATAGRL